MKYILSLFIFISPVLVFAQSEEMVNDSLVKQKWEELKSSWTFDLPKTGKGAVDIRTFNKYKSLFDSTAYVAGDIDAVYLPDSKSDSTYTYLLEHDSSIAFDSYAHDIALHFYNLKIETDTQPFKITSTEKEIIYTVIRKVTGEKKGEFVIKDEAPFLGSIANRKEKITELKDDNVKELEKEVSGWFDKRKDFTYQFQLTDTIQIHFNVSKVNAINISSITKKEFNEPPICLNDIDGDGLVLAEDNCPDQKGDITAKGCPDFDFDGVADSLDACTEVYYTLGNNGCPTNYFKDKFSISFFAGLQINNCDLNLTALKNLGYNQVDFNESQQGSITSPGLNISPVYGGDISWYFVTKKRNAGVSVGLNYTSFSATYRFNESAVYTFKANDGVNDYRRRVTIAGGSTEGIKYHVLDFPILFKYRNRFGKPEKKEEKSLQVTNNKNKEELPWSWEVSFGPSVIYFNNTSNYNVNINFEGLYQIDTLNPTQFTYYDYYDNGSNYNLALTGKGLNNQSPLPGVDTVFNFLNANSYDFAYNKNYSGQDKKANRVSVAINANFHVSYRANESLSFKIGVSILAAPLADKSEGYASLQNTADTYKSFYQSKTNSFYITGGLNVGIVIDWR